MAFTITVRGIKVTCETAGDAWDLVQLAETGTTLPKKRGPGRPPTNGHSPQRETRLREGIACALKFLAAVDETGRVGVDGAAIVEALGLGDPRAVGGTIVRVKSVLRKLEFDPDRAFRKRKTNDGNRWRPGPQIAEAIKTLMKSQNGSNL